MVDFVHDHFPNLHGATFLVPPLQFASTKYSESDSLPPGMVQQDKTAPASLASYTTMQLVRRCIAHTTSKLPDPLFVLFDYPFDEYLCESITTPGKGLCPTLPAGSKSQKTKSAFTSTEFCGKNPQKAGVGLSRAVANERRERLTRLMDNLKSRNKMESFSKVYEVFPSPQNLHEDKRGDFDVLIISRKYGFIVMEAKSLADKMKAGEDFTAEEQEIQRNKDQSLRVTIVEKALRQLSKAEKALEYMFTDLPETVPVTKCLALPNAPRSLLQQMIEEYPELMQVSQLFLFFFLFAVFVLNVSVIWLFQKH